MPSSDLFSYVQDLTAKGMEIAVMTGVVLVFSLILDQYVFTPYVYPMLRRPTVPRGGKPIPPSQEAAPSLLPSTSTQPSSSPLSPPVPSEAQSSQLQAVTETISPIPNVRRHSTTPSVSSSATLQPSPEPEEETETEDQEEGEEDGAPLTLYICTKCARPREEGEQCTPETECRLAVGSEGLADMEDMALPPPEKTGGKLYRNLLERHASPASPTYAHRRRLRLQPTECLSVCSRANAVAFSGPGKYAYQFGDINENDPAQVEDILNFGRMWVEDPQGFSKTRTRPTRMRTNILARIPPMPPAPSSSSRLHVDREAKPSKGKEPCDCQEDFI
ncbi:MAG: hypothetical protein DHS80DRAFT_33020 [Piptocephalis tieghemiana]|nr:MAG: hypothetical protein DHS80DRAFT_33020 [Piptocephalis tieghemiana]